MQREQVNCSGCKGDGSKFFICGLCQIRECAVTKRLCGCKLCFDYSCHGVNLLTGAATLKSREASCHLLKYGSTDWFRVAHI